MSSTALIRGDIVYYNGEPYIVHGGDTFMENAITGYKVAMECVLKSHLEFVCSRRVASVRYVKRTGRTIATLSLSPAERALQYAKDLGFKSKTNQ